MRSSPPYLKFLAAAFFVLGLLAGGCSTNSPAFDGIANRGVTPVSPQSPYIGANVFLAQEMEGSVYLYNFVRSRGAPQAIQVQGSSEMESELLMFYSREREYYSAVPRIEPTTKTKEWIIRGPFPVTREQYPYVAHLHSGQGGIFEVFGRQEVLGGAASATESRIIHPAFIPTPAPTPKLIKRKAKRSSASAAPAETAGPAVAVQGTPINLDQEALLESKRTATTPPQPSPAAAQITSAPASRPSLDDALRSAVQTPTAPAAAPIR